jgi:hypothetical protein
MKRGQAFFALGGAGALATLLALAASAPATQGCQTHQCDQSNLTIGLGPDGGAVGTGYVLVDPPARTATWYSGPYIPDAGETWQPYPGNQYLTFLLPQDAGIPPNAVVQNWGAAVAAQDAEQVNNVPGSGQLDEFSNIGPTSVTVFNDTCADYYVRVWVQFSIPEGGPPQVDAAEAAPPADASEAGAEGSAGD